MRMSSARIRSLFRRHHSVQEQVFRFTRNVQPVTCFSSALAPATASQLDTRRAAIDEHYRVTMQRELAKLRL